MAFSAILSRFREHSPLPVMARALLERALTEEKLEACFENATEKRYTRELLFSSIFELMSLVVTQTFSSINAAYQARRETIGVSITSVYNKLNGLETSVSAALVRDSAMELGGMIHALKATCLPLLPGYRVKRVDGKAKVGVRSRPAPLSSINISASSSIWTRFSRYAALSLWTRGLFCSGS
ncbi:hypothetical protein [Nitrosococcus wardiae]|uniref:Uncharacterized protein n=1 Tax=Nitrosococcus wardiae TaxID=1814290 RepID=A0A4P7BVA5_9GAMM|nr:hypothetical protein [Nitrosococcus wardiae]QBQ53938.1 hypothetical protein E3U44_05000 [Nitrosococcus wardiae]